MIVIRDEGNRYVLGTLCDSGDGGGGHFIAVITVKSLSSDEGRSMKVGEVFSCKLSVLNGGQCVPRVTFWERKMISSKGKWKTYSFVGNIFIRNHNGEDFEVFLLRQHSNHIFLDFIYRIHTDIPYPEAAKENLKVILNDMGSMGNWVTNDLKYLAADDWRESLKIYYKQFHLPEIVRINTDLQEEIRVCTALS